MKNLFSEMTILPSFWKEKYSFWNEKWHTIDLACLASPSALTNPRQEKIHLLMIHLGWSSSQTQPSPDRYLEYVVCGLLSSSLLLLLKPYSSRDRKRKRPKLSILYLSAVPIMMHHYWSLTVPTFFSLTDPIDTVSQKYHSITQLTLIHTTHATDFWKKYSLW